MMIELFPGGFEERDLDGRLELAAYGDDAAAACLRDAFGTVRSDTVELGWEERWRDFHRGAVVGGLWIGPPWEDPPPGVGAIVIDPGQAFGTGAHPTTRLCLELLGDLPRASLLDVGCGSGVLAIAAVRLGFAPVHAVDVDPLAVDATKANADVNDVEIEVVGLDALSAELPAADIVVANLTLPAVTALAPRIRAEWLVTSGYLGRDSFAPAGFQHVRRTELGDWAADVWTLAQAQ